MQTTLTRISTNQKLIGSYLHQLLNHAAMLRNYAEYFSQATNDKNIKHITKQMDSNIIVGIEKLCKAIGSKELQAFTERKIVESPRMLNLMRIMEKCSRLNEESIEAVADSLDAQLDPILEEENKLMNQTN